MLKVIPKFLRDAKAGDYKPSVFGRIRDFLQRSEKVKIRRGVATAEILMLDISFYQSIADFDTMLKNGVQGVIIRAGQNKWIDTKSETFMSAAEDAGMPAGSYWFYDSRVAPKIQAETWKQVLGKHKTPLYCWADYEENYGGSFSGWKNFYNFLEACKSLMPDRKFGIYTGYYYWLEHSPITAASLNYFGQYPLWLAWYTADLSYVKIPKPWTKITIWQKMSSGDGAKYGVGSREVDIDSFLGTHEDFECIFGTTQTPPVVVIPPEPIPTPEPPTPETGIFRIIWDDENPEFNFKSRTETKGWGNLKAPPAVYRFYPKMVSNPNKKQGDFRVDITDWKQPIIALNGGSIKKFNYLTGKQRAQFNFTGFPKMAYLVMSGNLVKGEVIGNWLKFETFKPTDVSKIKGMTYRTNPYLIHSFHCVKYDKKLKKTIHVLSTGTNHGEVFYPLISKEGYGYIPLKYVRKVR